VQNKIGVLALFTIKVLRFQVEVLPSLQRPKKVAVLASDGHTYNLLCKPKVRRCQLIFMIGYDNITCMQDDLRKDARLMEFNTLVNKVI
jgi:serine/threonine-protein kinase ATR